jgi:dipeptidase
LVSFAVDRGWFDPAAGKPFRFDEVYGAHTPQTLRYTATRVWSLFRRLAPSLDLSTDYHRGVAGASPYPLWVTPDRRLTVADVMALMRDHYEGTPYDMTRGVDAGPFGSPYRPRPMAFEVDGRRYSWERPVSTPQSGFSFVAQSRSWLPDPVGGVTWYGVDDTFTTCYVPVYCGVDRVPEAFATGTLERFSWDSAYWVFNFVANFANLRYSAMIKDIEAVQRELEGHLLALQPAVELVAVALHNTDRALLVRYLTDYSVSHGQEVVRRWRELAERLVAKYNDGYLQDAEGEVEEVGYPEEWLRRVVRERGEGLLLEQPAPNAAELPY